MRSYVLTGFAIISTALAIPIAGPQDLPMDSYIALGNSPEEGPSFNDVPDPMTATYDPIAAQTSAVNAIRTALAQGATTVVDFPAAASSWPSPKRNLAKRGTCLPYSAGNGPTVHSPDDSVASFYEDPMISGDALTAATPAGYALAEGYLNLNSSSRSPTYLTYMSEEVTSYDPSICAAACNDISGCVSFNIYFERDPSEDADDTNCPTPPSLTRIKCAFFGSMLSTAEATNFGQYQSRFHVVIAGSNAYNKPPAPLLGFTGPVDFGNATINSPLADKSYMRVQTFPQTQLYDPNICAAACNAESAYAQRHNSTRLCKFFDVYVLYKNGMNGVFTCTYYTQAYDLTYAKNKGQYDSQGNHYTVMFSVGYTAN